MKAYGYLVIFLVTFFGLPLFFTWLLEPLYNKIPVWPFVLLTLVLLPLAARFLSVLAGNRSIGFRSGPRQVVKQMTVMTIVYYIVLFSSVLVLLYFVGGFP